MYSLCVSVSTYGLQHVCGGQRTSWQNLLSPSTMCILGAELGASNMAANNFILRISYQHLVSIFEIIVFKKSISLCIFEIYSTR